MSVVLSKAVKEKIKKYHRYHHDTSIKIVKVVKDSDGYDGVLVRVTNVAGYKYSCIDVMDLQGDFSEIDSAPTEDESELIKWFSSEQEVDNEWED